MKYDVTIGIPVYYTEAYVRRALESAFSQTYPSIEFLIVEDGGRDGSLNIIKDMMSSTPRREDIHLIIHQDNKGVSASRNEIIRKAQGEYLYFMDSDDVIAENAIELLMQNVRQYEAEIAFGSYMKVEISGNKQVYQYPALQLLGEDKLASFAYRKYAGIQASACNYLVKTSLLRDRNCRFMPLDYWEDFVFTFDLVTCISRAVLLPDITYYYYCRENSLSQYQERETISKDEILRNAKALDLLKINSLLSANKEYYSNRCFNIVMTDFYIACHVLKRRKDIVPYITSHEIKAIMSHPASFREICFFRQSRMKNMVMFLLGKLPVSWCVSSIWLIGKLKKLV